MKPRILIAITLIVLITVAILIWQGKMLSTVNISTSDNNTEFVDNVISQPDTISDINSTTTDKTAKVEPEDAFGKLVGYSYSDCLAIGNNSLKKGDKVRLVLPDAEESQEILETTIEGPVQQENECGPWFIEPGGLSLPYQSFYKLATKNYSIAIAIVESDLKSQIKGNFITVDLDSNGTLEFFSACDGFEGVNLYVWSGEPWKSQEPLWHSYVYLGYDIEPTCPSYLE